MNITDKKYTEQEIEQLEDTRLKYETLLETVPAITWFMDTEGKYKEVNREFLKHSGKRIEEIKNRNHREVWEFKKGDECEKNDLEVIENKKKMKFNEIVYGMEGYRGFEVYRSPVVDEKGKTKGIIAVAKDITDMKNGEVQFKILIENLPFGIWQYDMDGNIVIANERFAKRFGMTAQEISKKNIAEVYDEELSDIIRKENEIVIAKKEPVKIIKKSRKNNEETVLEVCKIPIMNIVNEVIGIVGSCTDITEVVKAREKAKMQAYTDYNTGLLNRRALYNYINNEIKDKAKTIIILDIDNFKNINDTYGHHIGDTVLVKVSESLKNIEDGGKVFRFGGDEFLIVYDKKLEDDLVEEKAKEILDIVSKIGIENEGIRVSIGIASCGCDKSCASQEYTGECRLIIKADIALYNAKRFKKSSYVVYTEKLEEEMIFMSKLEKELSHIVERDQLKLVYQPQCTVEGEIIGFEALFRWENKEYDKVPVQAIIEIMEKNKSIIPVSHEIIRKACIFANKINENRKEKVIVSFNISTVQLMEDNFIEEIKAIMAETCVDARTIGIEITETIIIKDIEKNIEKLMELKNLGMKISLDDFGTGYSSFSYLIKLPLSVVKIDRSFSLQMDSYEKYKTLIKLIVDTSKSLNLDVIAEGIETKKQLKVLKDTGVKYIQGYLFSKPLEEKEAIKVLNRGNLKK